MQRSSIRRTHARSRVLAGAAIAGGVLLGTTGCADQLRQDAIESRTREWFSTLRAAQVLPVFPLTEDLEPGDVFLVNVPIQRQHEVYLRDGYVPLDLMGARLKLPDQGYESFYADRYWTGDFAEAPFTRPLEAGDPVMAPRVVFPRLEVVVATDGSASFGLPLQSVSAGLATLDATRARVTVDLRDAFTYALPGDMLLDQLRTWAAEPENRDMLGEMASEAAEPVYVRCVTRVFLVRNVTVGISVVRDRSQSVGVGAGASPAAAPAAGDGTGDRTAIDDLKEALAAAGPSGSVKLRQAVGSSLTLDEDLGTPMAIGYLGFDVPIRRSGDLGPPVATLQVLQDPGTVNTATLGVGERSVEERLMRVAVLDLNQEVDAFPGRAAGITDYIARGLNDAGLIEAAARVADASDADSAVNRVRRVFGSALRRYVSEDAGEEIRSRRARRLIDAAIADPTIGASDAPAVDD